MKMTITLEHLLTKPLNQVEALYQRAIISRKDVIAYLREWNKGPHIHQAVLRDGSIRLFDPEKSGKFYFDQKEEFGLNLPALQMELF